MAVDRKMYRSALRCCLRKSAIPLLALTTLWVPRTNSSLSAVSNDLSPQEILRRSLLAQGGVASLENIQTFVLSGKAEVLGGLTGRYEVFRKAPDRLKTVLDADVVHEERGFDGKSGWEKLTSVRELSGRDLDRLKRTSIFNPLVSYSKLHVPVTLVAREEHDCNKCYLLEFTPTSKPPDRFLIDAHTFLPIQEIRLEPFEEGDLPIIISFADYRKVQDVWLPFSVSETTADLPLTIQVDNYQLNVPIDDAIFHNPLASSWKEPYEVSLTTIPRHVYKENDGPWQQGWQRFWAIPYGPTESWFFNIVVNEKYGRQLDPMYAKLELFAGSNRVKTQEFPRETLDTLKKFPVTRFAQPPEIFDIRHTFSEPLALGVDRIVYSMILITPSGTQLEKTLDIPIEHYQLKRKYIFPIRGNFYVAYGHDFYELGHTYEWSQHYAYDIVGLGPNMELYKNTSRKVEDFFTWGREIVAPADGVIVFARDDVLDTMLPSAYLKLHDPVFTRGGNLIVIDHGDQEFSLMAHSQHGSVRVKVGDHVTQGQVIASIGCSASPGHPHLHYQLQSGPGVFDSDGLPVQFDNLVYSGWIGNQTKALNPKRGIFMEAR